MNRRRFARAAILFSVVGFRPSGSRSADVETTDLEPAATPVPEERCIPALAISLGLGQAFVLERSAGRTLSVRFVAVEDDGRCAVSQGVQCVWAGQATVVVEVDRGSGSVPEIARIEWVAGDAFQVVWGHQGISVFVVAAALSGDAATPREDLVLSLVILPDWPSRG